MHINALAPLLLIAATALSTGCTLMKQPVAPDTSSTTHNALSASVSVLPINVSTLQKVSSAVPVPPPQATAPVTIDNWHYRIGPGDVLSIVVWDHPQLTIPAGPQRTPQEAGNWVSPEGTIFYPYIGTLRVAGKTIAEVREQVKRGLRSVIPNPQVDVSIARFSSQTVQITGAVNSPGKVPVTNIPLTLIDAIALREGHLSDGDLTAVSLKRGTHTYTVNLQAYLTQGLATHNPQLQGGDIVVIPRIANNEVYVMGEVNKPRVVALDDNALSLTEALAGSDGLIKTSADASGIFVFRASDRDDHINVYQLSITDPTALLLGTRFNLIRGDVVYVTSAPATRWNRIIANLIPSLSAINTLLLIDDRR